MTQDQSKSRSERESQQAHDEAARSFPIARPVREWFGKILDAENRQIVNSVSPEYAVQIVHLLNHGAPVSERGRLEAAALDAAFAFIDSHVADPDITEEMRHKYAVYKEARAALEAPRSERPD